MINLSDIDPTRQLVIAHCIILTAEQRKALQTRPASVQAEGVSVPVWVVDGKPGDSREVFCWYTVTLGEVAPPLRDLVEVQDDGYVVTFYKSSSSLRLLTVKEGGNGGLSFSYSGMIKIGDKYHPVVHQVSIMPKEEMYE